MHCKTLQDFLNTQHYVNDLGSAINKLWLMDDVSYGKYLRFNAIPEELELGKTFPNFIFSFVLGEMTNLRTLSMSIMMSSVPQYEDFYQRLDENRSINNLIFLDSSPLLQLLRKFTIPSWISQTYAERKKLNYKQILWQKYVSSYSTKFQQIENIAIVSSVSVALAFVNAFQLTTPVINVGYAALLGKETWHRWRCNNYKSVWRRWTKILKID